MKGRTETDAIIAALEARIERRSTAETEVLRDAIRRLRYLQAMADSREELLREMERLAGAASVTH